MDDAETRLLIRQFAGGDLPPATVDMEQIRRDGRRLRRRRRAAAAGGAAVALVCASGIVAGIAVPRHLSMSPSAVSGPDRHGSVPRSRPSAVFGWLPAGFVTGQAAGPMFGNSSRNARSAMAGAGDPATGRYLVLTVFAAGVCRLTGPGRVSVVVSKDGIYPPRTAVRRYPQAIACSAGRGDSQTVIFTRPATPVSGQPAYWVLNGGLAWRQASGQWASLVTEAYLPGAAPLPPGYKKREHAAYQGWKPHRAGIFGFGPATVQSPRTSALLIKVASAVRWRS